MVKSSATSITPAQHADRHSIGGADPLVDPLFLHAARHAYGGADEVARGVYSNEQGVKAVNTIYQNTNARPMLIAISFLNAAGTIHLELGAATPPATDLATDNAPNYPNICFIVPPAWYYRVQAVGGTNAWFECIL